MPPLFPIGLALVAVAVVLSLLLRRADWAAYARAKALATATLDETGLSLDGSSLGAFTLRGRSAGVDLVLDNAAVEKRPGPSGESSTVCMVRVDVPCPDMVVCRTGDIDSTMGPLPSADRPRTGHVAFDARYAAFVAREQSVTREQSAYRGADPASAGPWAAPATLDRLMDLELAWMRVRDGKAEIALARLSPEDAGRALAVGANVARSARGEALVDVRAGALAPIASLPDASLIATWAVAGVAGAFVGFLLSFFEGPRAIDQEAVCGRGATLLHTESSFDGGTNHDFHCSNNQDSALIALHCFSCVLVVAGLFAIILLLRTALRRTSSA